MAKYSDYIALSPNYESVVDIDSDTRNPDMWHEYIVHEDMQTVIEKVCDSLKYEVTDQRRSFWIHGAYGTGKSYAAIVLKHLFEDKVDKVEKFLSNSMLIHCREKFLSLREKGDFLVIWKSQTNDISNGTQLMMTMESAIRGRLREKYGDRAYYGRSSLLSAAQKAVADRSVNWVDLFDNPAYRLYEDYENLQDFQTAVTQGNLNAATAVARIYRDKGWGFLKSLDDFRAWVTDVIQGNHLQDTGIIFIWDEFTSYIRNNPTDDILQPLSEFCKKQPLFMFLIVHKDSGIVSQIGEKDYERIMHRFHSIEFHVSESAAYELIGSSILIRAGMEEQWKVVQNKLMKSINKDRMAFGRLELAIDDDRLRKLCPIHPMTISLLSVVAEHFAASQRTLFRFMKDSKESEQNVGFIYYINHFDPDGWRWLTPDFLWDYFFTRESDVYQFSAEARNAYQHFMTKQESISDEYHMHVFKAAMLLLAVVSSGNVSNSYSRSPRGKRTSPTRSTLYSCFSGILNKDDVDGILEDLKDIGALQLDEMQNDDMRLQIPYSGGANLFDARKAAIKGKLTRYELFKKNGTFAKSVEAGLWDNNRASAGRMYITAADEGTKSVNARLEEVQNELEKHPYKFGILAICLSQQGQVAAAQDKAKTLAAGDKTGRMAVYVLKEPLTEDQLDRWYIATTHYELANEEGKKTDSGTFSQQADEIVDTWAATAVSGQIFCAWGGTVYPSEYGAYAISGKLEKDVLFGAIFPAAPEQVVTANTAFKKSQQNSALAGVQKVAPNAQVGGVMNRLKEIGVWNAEGLEALSRCSGNTGADAIAKTALFLHEKFSQGTLIKLDDLWQELQKSPFGYYDSIAGSYILGFLMREYVNSTFTWNRGDNNPWPLTEQNLADMISAMCKENAVNNYLSPGSEVWKKFKDYAQKIFDLQDKEAVNETEARKYISKQCTEKAGAPFWVLKYLPADQFGGETAKNTADEIIDLFCVFMTGEGDQEQVMSNLIEKFKGTGVLRKTLHTLYFSPDTVQAALSDFILRKCPELEACQREIGLTNHDLSDAIHQMMQGQVSSWTEKQVEEKLEELCLEYRTVAILNSAMGTERKTIRNLSEEIANSFNYMKVPGAIIEKMNYPWTPALKAMRAISTTQWAKIDPTDREAYTAALQEYGQEAWEIVKSSRLVLQKYMEVHESGCTEDEIGYVYENLDRSRYDSPEADFQGKINAQVSQIVYKRNSERIQELWKTKSGAETVTQWCNDHAVPIQWVVTDEEQDPIRVIKNVQDGKRAESTELENALEIFDTHSFSNLRNEAHIQDCFFAQIGEGYRDAFQEEGNTLVGRMKTDRGLTREVYTWNNKLDLIRKTLDEFLKGKYCEKAKKQVRTMPEIKLREKVIQLLDENPDLYSRFME